MNSDQPNCCEARALLSAISRAQEHFIREDDPRYLFDELLSDFLQLTDSAYGFIGEILHTAAGIPYLKTHAITNVAWNSETRAFYEKHAPEGLEFFNLKTLFGAVIETGEPVIANAPASDHRSGGTPAGHPRLDAFLGVPVLSGDSLVGMIGVANRPGGYDESQIEFLQPLLKTYGQLIYSSRIRKQREEAYEALRKSRDELEDRVSERTRELENLHADLLGKITERKKVEEMLRNISTRNQAILDTVPDIIAEVDVNKVYAWINEAGRHFFGDAIIGKDAAFYFEGEQDTYEKVQPLFEGDHSVFYVESWQRRHDGEKRLLAWWCRAIIDESGKVTGALSTARDITDQRLIEEERRKSEERFRNLVENTSDWIWEVDAAGRFTYSSPQVEQLLGYGAEEIIGRTPFELMSLDEAARVMEFFGKTASARKSFSNFENMVLRRDGTVVTVETSGIPFFGAADELLGYRGVNRDITARRQTETTLKESRDRLQRVLRYSNTGLWDWDLQTNEVYFSPEWKAQLGYADDELPNRFEEWENRLHPEDHDRAVTVTWDYIKQRNEASLFENEFRLRHKDGSYRTILTRASLLTDKDGKAERMFGLHIDITDRKKMENELRKSKESLANAQRIARLGNWDWDIVDNNLYWSDEIYHIFGIEPQEFTATYEAFLAIVHPADREFVMLSVNEALRDHKPYDIHHRIVLPDGNERIVREQAEIVRDNSGCPLSMTGTVQDVTDLKKAELSLRESEGRFRTLVEQSPFVIQIYSPDGVIQMVNRAFEQLWGMNAEMLAGYNILKDPQLVEKGVMPYIEMGFAGKAVEVPVIVYDPALNPVHGGPASNRSIRTFIYPVLDDAGNAREIILFQEDVTEQRKAEDQLRQAAAVFEHTAEAVVITDPQANILAVNRAFSEITGYSPEEALGHNPRILKSERHEREFYETMWDSLQKTGYWRGEIWNRRKNGEIFPVWSTISAIRNEAGRLTHYVSIFSDITSLKHSEEQLYYLAHHDPLTDLPNRLLFNERLGHAMVRARREGHRIAIMFIDLDRFKNINDSLGHPVGDQLLQEVARRLMEELREEDTVARLGGDEFIILVEEVSDAGHVAPLAQKLLEALRRPLTIEGRNLNFTASLGISIFPEDGGDVATLVKNADAALYRAKEEGRNEFQFYTRELTSAAFERVLLESSLRRALEQKELVPYYQPLFSLETGKVTGIEVLLRWQHQTMGLILPSRFIPLAEETGLIIPIGEWVLHTACTQMRAWQKAGIALDFVAVNISQVRFQRGDFAETISRILEETGLDPRYLELEITESIVMHKPERTVEILGRLKDLGVRLSLDDFGTGYSSLSHLKTLPVNKLKIDQSFVRGLPWGANDKAIVIAIIALGWIMGIKVTAEGVETEEQREFLKAQGCREYQGFLSGRPMPAEEFEKFMMRQ